MWQEVQLGSACDQGPSSTLRRGQNALPLWRGPPGPQGLSCQVGTPPLSSTPKSPRREVSRGPGLWRRLTNPTFIQAWRQGQDSILWGLKRQYAPSIPYSTPRPEMMRMMTTKMTRTSLSIYHVPFVKDLSINNPIIIPVLQMKIQRFREIK